MPSFDIIRRWNPQETFRTQTVRSSFTLENAKLEKRFIGSLPVENEDWQIGVIVGRSGTGKTTIAKEIFKEAYIGTLTYTHSSILDDFDKELPVTEITKTLCSVGFASPPDWLKSYDQLSQGEKMRVDVARAISMNKELIVFDEFTSVVDREVAQISSVAIAKSIRKTTKKFVAVTCHYDIVEWLEPDWVFSTDEMKFIKKKSGDQKFRLRSADAGEIYGESLGSIII
jgi:ABC-type ATPase with predicted acetyltransferase domain